MNQAVQCTGLHRRPVHVSQAGFTATQPHTLVTMPSIIAALPTCLPQGAFRSGGHGHAYRRTGVPEFRVFVRCRRRPALPWRGARLGNGTLNESHGERRNGQGAGFSPWQDARTAMWMTNRRRRSFKPPWHSQLKCSTKSGRLHFEYIGKAGKMLLCEGRRFGRKSSGTFTGGRSGNMWPRCRTMGYEAQSDDQIFI